MYLCRIVQISSYVSTPISLQLYVWSQKAFINFDSTFLQKFVMCKSTIIYMLKDTCMFHISANITKKKFKDIFYLVLFVMFYHIKFRRSATICPHELKTFKNTSLLLWYIWEGDWMFTITILHTSSHNDLP